MKKKLKTDSREEAEVKKEAKARFEELEEQRRVIRKEAEARYKELDDQRRDIRARRYWRRWTGAG